MMSARLKPEHVSANPAPTLIGIGALAWSASPYCQYSTLLGSCIAVCLWDPIAAVGGINHFLLAEAPANEQSDNRYGSVSLPVLVGNLVAAGCVHERLRAIVAGGADMLSDMHPIGSENTAFALDWLRREGILIEKKDVGGSCARRVRFNPTEGVFQSVTIQSPDVVRS